MQMDYTDYLIYKGLILCGLAFIVNFIYGLFTGQSLSQAHRDKEEETPPKQDP